MAEPVQDSGGGGIRGMLTSRMGPLPMWAWGAIAFALALGYMYYRSKKQAAPTGQPNIPQTASVPTSNNPTSNLATTASPMPIQLGDTYVGTQGGTPTVQSTTGIPNTTVVQNPNANTPPAANMTPGTPQPPTTNGNAATQVGQG